MNRLVSVIIPVYNTEAYLDETIQSVVDQTYKNIEIILIDDGSTDLSGSICDGWEKRDSRINVIHTVNRGPIEARNTAINNSRGDYILPVDSDDRIGDKYIEKAVTVLDNNPDVGIVYCNAEHFGAITGEWKITDYSIQEMLIHNCIFATAMFRIKDWEKVGGYSNDMKAGLEDYDLWLSIVELKRKVYKIPEVLFYYRKHDESRSKKYESDRALVKKTEAIKFSRHQRLYSELYYIPEKGKKISLYGAGGAGKTYFNFLSTIDSKRVACWVDAGYDKLKEDDYEAHIENPLILAIRQFDIVVVAINNKDVFHDVKEQLMSKGYKDEQVQWYINENALKNYR